MSDTVVTSEGQTNIIPRNGSSKPGNGKLHFKDLTKKEQRLAILLFDDMPLHEKAKKAGYKCKNKESYQALAGKIKHKIEERVYLNELLQIVGAGKTDWLREVTEIARKDKNLKAYDMVKSFTFRADDYLDMGVAQVTTSERVTVFIPTVAQDSEQWAKDAEVILSKSVSKRKAIEGDGHE